MLEGRQVPASFFLTGNFYRNKRFSAIIRKLKKGGHYLGAHSDRHLLYCSWEKRDSLLVSKETFSTDLLGNYEQLRRFGVKKENAPFFLPPYEWYNDSISQWTRELGLQLINFSPGTLSTADYTWPGLSNYRTSEEIYGSIINYEKAATNGLNGFILLVHLGTDPRRKDRFYYRLPQLIDFLKSKGYAFQRIDDLLSVQ